MASAEEVAEIVGDLDVDFDAEARLFRTQQWNAFIEGVEDLKSALELNSKPFQTIQVEQEGLSDLLCQAKFDFNPEQGETVRCLDIVCKGYIIAKDDSENSRRMVQFVSMPRNIHGNMVIKLADCDVTTMQFAEFQGSPQERIGVKVRKIYDPSPPGYITSDTSGGTIYVPISKLERR